MIWFFLTTLLGAPVHLPFTHAGVRYEQREAAPGVVFAIDEKTQKLAWQQAVHDGPFTATELIGEELVLNTQGVLAFVLDLKTHKAKILRYPVTLSAGTVTVTPKGWSYGVTVTIENTLKRAIALDGPSVGQGRELSNNLFTVTADGQPIRYQGMMAKRAPPSSFITVKPGGRYTATLDLTEVYPVPAATQKITIGFAHQNHFSPDDFELKSAAALELSAPLK